MGGSLQIVVVWPNREVRVVVEFPDPLADVQELDVEPEEERPPLAGLLDHATTEKRGLVVDFLRNVTQAVADGDAVRLQCWAVDRGRLFEALDVSPGSQKPVRVEV